MSVYRPKGRVTWIYDFFWLGRRYKGNTHQINEADARTFEGKLRLKLRREKGGIAEPGEPMFISEWADVFYGHLETLKARTGRPKRLEKIEELLRVVLRFWGRRPEHPDSPVNPQPGEEAPFYNLTLQDPIDTPEWILEWEAWMDRRKIAGGTRNHYNTTMSRMYAVALLAEYKRRSGIRENPFTGRPRAPQVTRKVTLPPALVLAWVQAMSYHTRLAVAMAALAPALRLQNVLGLTRAQIDPGVTVITIHAHKTDYRGVPIVQPISAQLREILLDAFARMKPGCSQIVQYHGHGLASIRGGLIAAARQAGIPYGRFTQEGVTFHTLRHTASTLLAQLGVNPWLHAGALNHTDLRTTAGYTHLKAEEQRPVLEQLSTALPISAFVTAPGRRVTRSKVVGPAQGEAENPEGNRRNSAPLTRGAYALAGRRFPRKPNDSTT